MSSRQSRSPHFQETNHNLANARKRTLQEAQRLGVDTRGLEHDVLQWLVDDMTGVPGSPMRPGQMKLMDAVIPMTEGDQLVAAAPTGTGKSFAVLIPAMVRALRGERTLISTEMKSLQNQLLFKDAPAVQRAVEELTGVAPTFALHQGWSNYACLMAAADTAVDAGGKKPTPTSVKRLGQDAAAIKAAALDQIDAFEKTAAGASGPARDQAEAARWALSLTGDQRENGGDVNSFPMDKALWSSISIESGDCLKTSCPFFSQCIPRLAREKAATADVVITNHYLLGIQAATSAPVVLGNKTFGDFQHIVIDECHSLPDIVRGSGAEEISAFQIRSICSLFERDADQAVGLAATRRLARRGHDLADRLSVQLSAFLGPGKHQAETTILPDQEPLGTLGQQLIDWTSEMHSVVSSAAKNNADNPLGRKMFRLDNRITKLNASVSNVMYPEADWARWIQASRSVKTGRDEYAVKLSPVEVGSMMAGNLWQRPVPRDPFEDVPADPVSDEEIEGAKKPLSVVAMSATVMPSFCVEAALRGPLLEVDSPFDAEYANSAILVPKIEQEWVRQVASPSQYDGKLKFDPLLHEQWAAETICRLVAANRGSALVLSATVRSGRLYVERLRQQHPELTVLSQWDQRPLLETVRMWREHTESVLVGTKSLMTGVDAPGATCSLVVIDRPPRKPKNPVDEARVEVVQKNLGVDKWAADRMVYVNDAALLVRQGRGRMIRKSGDAGMVAVLDGRMVKGLLRYPDKTRETYMRGTRQFGHKFTSVDDGVAWLEARHRRQ